MKSLHRNNIDWLVQVRVKIAMSKTLVLIADAGDDN
jgi:hypothetical protein